MSTKWIIGGVLTIVLGVLAWQLDLANQKIERLDRQVALNQRETRPSLVNADTDSQKDPRVALEHLRADSQKMQREIKELQTEINAIKEGTGRSDPAATNTSVADFVISDLRLVPSRVVERWEGGPKRRWGHEQAAGEPDTPEAGDRPTAWASKLPDGGEEWLKLDYNDAVDLGQINVMESYNPGAISKLTAVLDGGEEVVVWEGTLDSGEPNQVMVSEFEVSQAVKAKSVEVYLDTKRVPGWNEIDAVEMVGKDGSKQWATASSASSSYAD